MPHSTSRRRSNGEMNKLLPEDQPAHNWYRFVLSFPPHLVRDYLTRFGLAPTQWVLDPFCGTGTTLVESKKLGIASMGIEANPMAHFAASVKVDWSLDPQGLVEHASEIAEEAAERLAADGVEDDPDSLFAPKVNTHRRPACHLRTLGSEQMKLLLSGSISPRPLHKTLVLRDCIKQREHPEFSRHERLALAKALVCSISNLHFGPEVGVGTHKPDAVVLSAWLSQVEMIATHLRQLRQLPETPARVVPGDARELLDVDQPEFIDAVITSPPYPNEKDYTRTTRLESVILEFICSKDDLRALKRGLVRSNTRGVYKGDDDDQWIADHLGIRAIARAIEERRIELGKTSGFERMYHRVTKLYFGGMAKHLSQLRSILRPGAMLAYVVGDQASYLQVMIRTGSLLAEIAELLGYKVVGLDLFRTRLATATKEQLREEVLVLQWPGPQG